MPPTATARRSLAAVALAAAVALSSCRPAAAPNAADVLAQPWEQIAAWVEAHPGRFTFDTAFTGMTLLKSLLIDFAGGPGSLDGPFDAAAYEAASTQLWAYLNAIKRHFWKRGETFPASVAETHQLFAAGELDFLISPEAQLEKLRPQVWGDGTILDLERLPAEWRERFENVPDRKLAPKRSEIAAKALREPASEVMIRLADNFRRYVLEG